MKVAKIQNPAGTWIPPTLASTAAAAASFTNPPTPSGHWGNVSILDTAGATSYPIASLTYLLVYQELNTIGTSMTAQKAQGLVDFLWWAVHDRQSRGAALVYPTFRARLVSLGEGCMRRIT